jgi:hypothetical protein
VGLKIALEKPLGAMEAPHTNHPGTARPPDEPQQEPPVLLRLLFLIPSYFAAFLGICGGVLINGYLRMIHLALQHGGGMDAGESLDNLQRWLEHYGGTFALWILPGLVLMALADFFIPARHPLRRLRYALPLALLTGMALLIFWHLFVWEEGHIAFLRLKDDPAYWGLYWLGLLLLAGGGGCSAVLTFLALCGLRRRRKNLAKTRSPS